jgi:hypothetical protein
MSKYLTTLEQFNIQPNFWCSREYFEKASFHEKEVYVFEERAEALFVLDSEDSVILPPLNLTNGEIYQFIPIVGIWADLVGFNPKKTVFPKWKMKFLDYNYIYDPAEFKEMKGRKWTTFRKNSRKFPRRYGEENLVWADFIPVEEEIKEFAGEVLERISSDFIHDAHVMLRYLLNGENRAFLLDEESGKILAMNIWDENHCYINYRYAFCVGEPFLSEYVRLCFYQMVNEKYPGKLVNDGGVLDRPSLESFKDKLNPVEKLKIYSWEYMDEEEKA